VSDKDELTFMQWTDKFMPGDATYTEGKQPVLPLGEATERYRDDIHVLRDRLAEWFSGEMKEPNDIKNIPCDEVANQILGITELMEGSDE